MVHDVKKGGIGLLSSESPCGVSSGVMDTSVSRMVVLSEVLVSFPSRQLPSSRRGRTDSPYIIGSLHSRTTMLMSFVETKGNIL